MKNHIYISKDNDDETSSKCRNYNTLICNDEATSSNDERCSKCRNYTITTINSSQGTCYSCKKDFKYPLCRECNEKYIVGEPCKNKSCKKVKHHDCDKDYCSISCKYKGSSFIEILFSP